MEGIRFRLIFANDPDVFQERMNRFIADLDENVLLVDVKFSTTVQGAQVNYSALVHYKEVESWKD
ncbi:hypothetical protein [Calidithermus timidus]|jgi:hypothetical protein|uniref:hypothetical protein n=1 Tax=Calidithermus timidus TaxID=307124 RepID=UPI000371D5ED|nr:hypothetical protein [Calidithermus timidus]